MLILWCAPFDVRESMHIHLVVAPGPVGRTGTWDPIAVGNKAVIPKGRAIFIPVYGIQQNAGIFDDGSRYIPTIADEDVDFRHE